MKLTDYLESAPPRERNLIDEDQPSYPRDVHKVTLNNKTIRVYCPTCKQVSIFEPKNFGLQVARFMLSTHDMTSRPNAAHVQLEYACRDCSQSKVFALLILPKQESTYEVLKFGEEPPFSPSTPRGLVGLLDSHADLYFKGRRCEMNGLGVGAFAYYRRAVEDSTQLLLSTAEAIAVKEGNSEAARILSKAKSQWRFSEAIDAIKDAIPTSLFIHGKNPFIILHKVLSIGLHDRSDEECLELATSVRKVLVEFAGRIADVSRDHSELKIAISQLENVK